MKKMIFKGLLMAMSLATVTTLVTSCSEKEELVDLGNIGTRAAAVVTVSGVIRSNTTWTSSNEYHLDGKVYVTNNATLTIQPGTKIVGLYNSTPELASALVITRDGKINAAGTASLPIVMTAESGHQYPGGWGGLVVLGNAPINQAQPVYIEGIDRFNVPNGIDVSYGGNVANDNSGIIQYVRVEYAGANVSENNELNSFTFGGVGAGTTFDHCQAYFGEDDAFEFFGGTVNAKYLVSTSTHDDAFDFDFGYQGKLQFLVATVDASSTFYTKDPNGIECDNDATGTVSTPFTHPVISNLTVVGTTNGLVVASANTEISNGLKSGANFRRNAQFTLVNSILYGYPVALRCETQNSSRFQNNVVNGVNSPFTGLSPDGTNTAALSVAAIGLGTPWGAYKIARSLMPTANPANTGANFSGLDTNWFTATTYKGAIATGTNWLTEAWVR